MKNRLYKSVNKALCRFCVAVLVLAMTVCVSASGSAYWKGPSVVRAGDTITLTFYAGGGILGGSGNVSYDSSKLTLQGYQQLIGGSWAVELGGSSFVFYDNSMSTPIESSKAIFSATFTVNSGLQTGESISVTATGVTLSDGEQDLPMGSVSYNATIAAPLSDNCDLAQLQLAGVSISPAFSPTVTNYTASVPFTVSSVSVNAVADHNGAKVSVNNTQLTAGATTAVKITVTAEKGNTKTYTVSVTRAQDPNYVPSSNANLVKLGVEGYTLSPVFSPEVTQYYVWLPYETELVNLYAQVQDVKADVQFEGDAKILVPAQGNDISVLVTAEDGTQKVYVITAVRAPAHDKTQEFLQGERATEPATEPVTEPASEPSTEPPTEKTTQPSAQEQEEKDDLFSPVGLGILIGQSIMILCLLLLLLSRKKK